MSEWVDFKAIKGKVSMHMVLNHYGIELQGKGSKLVGSCPLHGGDNPRAFHVDTEKNVWKCFTGCTNTDKSGGGVIDFVSSKESVGFRDAALMLKHWFLGDAGTKKQRRQKPRRRQKKQSSDGAMPKQAEPPTPCVEPQSAQEHNSPLSFKLNLRHEHPYLQDKRKVTVELAEEFGIGYCPRGIMAGRIAIPIHNSDGIAVAYAGRDTKGGEPKYKFPSGFRKQLELYNLHRARKHGRKHGLILVEGYFDVLRVHQAGFPNVVALMGSSMSDAQERHIKSVADQVVLLFDGDEAGRACARKVAGRLITKLFVHIVKIEQNLQPDGLAIEQVQHMLLKSMRMDSA